jgi:hypothetical protein
VVDRHAIKPIRQPMGARKMTYKFTKKDEKYAMAFGQIALRVFKDNYERAGKVLIFSGMSVLTLKKLEAK